MTTIPSDNPQNDSSNPSDEVILSRFKKVNGFLNSKTANNGKFAAVDQGVISLSNFLASILLIRYVTPTELGVYVIGFLAIYLVRSFQDGLIIQPLNTYGAIATPEEFRKYFSAAAIQQVMFAALTSLAALIVGKVLTHFGNDTLGPAVFTLWFCFFTWQIQEFLRRTFYTRSAVGKAVILSVTSNIIRLSMIFILGNLGDINGRTGLNAIGWGAFAAALIGVWMAKSFFTRQIPNMVNTWVNNWRFGRWILGASIADWIVTHLYPIIMAGMVSFAAAGAYQALQNLVAPIHVLLRATDTFSTPLAARAYHKSGLARLKRILSLIYLVSGIPILLLLVLAGIYAPQLLYLLKEDTYLPFADGIFVMILFYFFLYINWPLQIAFRAIRQGKQIFFANLLAIISMFTIGLWLIHRWGLYGAIGGQALNAIIVSLVLLIAWMKFKTSAKSANQPEETKSIIPRYFDC